MVIQFYQKICYGSFFIQLFNLILQSTIRNDSLFAYILMLIKRLPSDNERKQFKDKLNRIVKKYEKDIDLNLIGFPKNYRELMYIKNLKNIT